MSESETVVGKENETRIQTPRCFTIRQVLLIWFRRMMGHTGDCLVVLVPRQAHSNAREVEINKSNDSTFFPIQLRHVINFFAMCPQK